MPLLSAFLDSEAFALRASSLPCHNGRVCGRFSLFSDDEDLVSLFHIDLVVGEHTPSWNVAPSHPIRVILDRMVSQPVQDPAATGASLSGQPPRQSHNGERLDTPLIRQRQMRLVEWGLVPEWAKPPFRPMINARSETLVEKPSFRVATSRRRCLVPANGYFEWQQSDAGAKQPWFLSGGDDDPVLAFAGIIEMRKDLENHWWPTCAIVTRSASDALGQIHERTPLVMSPHVWDAWLDPALADSAQIRGLLDAVPVPALTPRRVSRAVGSVKNNGPDLIRTID